MNNPTRPRGPIDWDEVKARLTRTTRAVAEAERLSQEDARKIMAQRARKLAQTPPLQPDASEILELVTFRLGTQRFGIEARFVCEFIPLNHITPIPDVPPFMLGMANLRGEVIAVVELRSFFDVPPGQPDASAPALVLGENRVEFALQVDHVEEVTAFRTTDFSDVSGAISSSGREWVRGISRAGMVLLDTEVILNDSRLFINEA